MRLFSVILVSFVILELDAFLDPECGKMPSRPQCTYDKSKITDTMPTCVLPADKFINCRSVLGMKPSQNIVPTWFNYKFARRGQEITAEYSVAFFYNFFAALMLEMLMPDVLHPLLFTKMNSNGPKNAKRTMATLMQETVWTKDYLLKMPKEGHSHWVESIKSVRKTHKAVQTRGYKKMEKDGCLIDEEDYTDEDTDDEVWDAFEADLAASDLLEGSRDIPPPSSWPTCADSTTCSECGSSCSSDCESTCSIMTTTTTDADGKTSIKETKTCDRKCSRCTNCENCAWKAPNCYTASPKTFNCENCVCNDAGKNCANCTGCTNFERCVNFTIPLYNQQALGFVIYTMVGFGILWPQETGLTACNADLWAFNHLWAGILHGLGVEDECNLLLLPNLKSAKKYYQELWDTYLLPTLFKFDKKTRFMMDNVLKGLKLITHTAFTPKLLLCRFVRDFLKIEPTNSCGILEPSDKMLDKTVTTVMMPQFMNNSVYRAMLNKGSNDMISASAQEYFPDGECENFERISKECFA